MIVDILLAFLATIINAVCFILPTWQIWPSDILQGLSYFFASIAKLNFIFPIDTLFNVIVFIVQFEVYYLSVKLILMVVNFFRGTGKGLEV